MIPIQGTLLWYNTYNTTGYTESGSSGVALSEDMSHFMFLIIAFRNYKLHGVQYQYVPINKVNSSGRGELFSIENGYIKSREYVILDGTHIQFLTCYDSNNGSINTNNPDCMIPVAIYGVVI